MKHHSRALAAGVGLALAALTPNIASATGVCYAFVPANYANASFDGDPPLVLRYIATHDFSVFAWYRIGFGLLVLSTGYAGLVNWSAQ